MFSQSAGFLLGNADSHRIAPDGPGLKIADDRKVQCTVCSATISQVDSFEAGSIRPGYSKQYYLTAAGANASLHSAFRWHAVGEPRGL